MDRRIAQRNVLLHHPFLRPRQPTGQSRLTFHHPHDKILTTRGRTSDGPIIFRGRVSLSWYTFAVCSGTSRGLRTDRLLDAKMASKKIGSDEIPVAQVLGGGAALWWDESQSSQKIYVDRQFFASFEDQVAALKGSKTVYIGNLSFYTTEAQIYELCQRVGPVKRIVMGLHRHTKTPCGFCFVEHFTAEAALENVGRITGLVLDDRILRAELDFGFKEGRQYGRGQSGGQVRDDRRFVYDASRSNKSGSERRKRRFNDDDDQKPNDDDIPPPPPETTTAANEESPREPDDGPASKRRRRSGDDDDDAPPANDDDDDDILV